MAVLAINGTEMPVPDSMVVSSYDITDASRNDRGDLLIDYIATKEKINCSWGILTDDEKNRIINATKSPENLTFDVTFHSVNGGIKTLKCYKGDISAGIASIKNNVIYWNDVKVNFIEL